MKSGHFVVLGLYEGHMASAVIMIDGKVEASGHEERFSKLKMDVGLPVQAANFCMTFAGVRPDEVDAVAVVGLKLDPRDHLTKKFAKYSVEDFVFENEHYWYPRLVEKNLSLDYFEVMGPDRICGDHYWDIKQLNLKASAPSLAVSFNKIRLDAIEKFLGIKRDRVTFLPHYMCHHYHAYYSGTTRGNDVVIMHNEGAGDGYNAVISSPTPNGLKMICGNNETDLGRLYKWMTLLLGMKPHQHEFKVMGLAPYSSVYERDKAAAVFDSLFTIDEKKMLICYQNRPPDLYFYFRDKLRSCRFDGIASALQAMVEKNLTDWFDFVVKATNKKRVCYAGGVAMNVKANKALAELNSIKELFVPISPADETTHLGAAYWLTETYFLSKGETPEEKIPPLLNAFVGPELDAFGLENKLEKVCQDTGSSMEECTSVGRVAKILSQGKVVARCRGRSELGQRALGNRSILGNPSKAGIVSRLNDQIKYRDFWMPFCPTILESDANIFLNYEKKTPAKFMTMGFDVRAEQMETIAGVIHPADGSARPQILAKSDNAEYHELISNFKKLTGVGCLLNTSFNLHGEPVVESSEDAIKTFLGSGLDALWVGDYLIQRNEKKE